MRQVVLGVAALLLAARSTSAAVLHIPTQYSSIYLAVAAAASGDTVLVAPGTYLALGNTGISFGGKDIVLVSEAGPERTIINCQEVNRAFELTGGETPAAVIDGFTIMRGRAPTIVGHGGGHGGGIYVYNSSPTIRNCVFLLCHVPCATVGHTESWADGGGVSLWGSQSSVSNCVFLLNSVDTCMRTHGSAVSSGGWGEEVRNCVMYLNTPGDVELVYGVSSVLHCVGDGAGPFEDDNLWGTDPGVCTAAQLDYGHPCSDSPALPENNPWGELIGYSYTVCTSPPCDTPVERSSWGVIKAMYR